MKSSRPGATPAVARRAETAKARKPRQPRAASARLRSTSGSGATPGAILEAALRIFARDGFDGASIPAIAKAASIGHPLVHYHFGSKQELWRAAVDYALGDLTRSTAALEEAAGDLEPVDALRLLCRDFARFTARHPLHTLLILNELRAGGERFDWLVEHFLRPLHARLDRAIEAAVASGKIRPVATVHLSSIAIGATAHFFAAAPLIARLYNVDAQDPDVVEAHTRQVLDILLNGLLVSPPHDSVRSHRS